MGIQFHPGQGVVVICDYSTGFVIPEMVKRRPAIIICKPMKGRPRLCTVVPLSTTPPSPVMNYHAEIALPFDLPRPFNAERQWIKGDMINSVSFDRLDLIRLGKAVSGRRLYLLEPISDDLMQTVQACVASALSLTKRP